MAHLHLPVQHTDDDLALAGALAQMLKSDELYVTWSSETGQAEPVVPAVLHDPPGPSPRRRTARPGWLARVLGLFRAP
jgi:hypothetical protein